MSPHFDSQLSVGVLKMTFHGSSNASNLNKVLALAHSFTNPYEQLIRKPPQRTESDHSPKIIRPILQTLTHKPLHKPIHIRHARHRPRRRIRTPIIRPTIIPALARPPDLTNHRRLLRIQRDIMLLPEIPSPARRRRRRDARKERMHVRHDDVDGLRQLRGPVVAEVAGGERQGAETHGAEVLAHRGQGVDELGLREVFGEEDFVADDDAGEGRGVAVREAGEDIPHLRQLPIVGRLVPVEVDAEPELHVGGL